MSIPDLTRADIKEHTAGGSYERGEEYLARGAVRSLERTDTNTLKARVQGSDVHPYLVTVKFDGDEITDLQCTCPYVKGSWCKHIVAVLLKITEDDDIPHANSAAVAEHIEDLDREELVALIEQLVEHNPELLHDIERAQARLTEEE